AVQPLRLGLGVDQTNEPTVRIPASVPVEDSKPLALRPAAPRSVRPMLLAALIAGGIVILILIARTWLSSRNAGRSSHQFEPREASPPTDQPRVEPSPGETIPLPHARPSEDRVSTDKAPKRAEHSSQGPSLVAEAQLCKSLSTQAGRWRCNRPDTVFSPG